MGNGNDYNFDEARFDAQVEAEAAKNAGKIDLDAEIEKLAALSIGTYEQRRKAEADRLGMRQSVLGSLVKAARNKDKPTDAGFLPRSRSNRPRCTAMKLASLKTLRATARCGLPRLSSDT